MWSTNVEKDYQMLIECDRNEEILDNARPNVEKV